MAGGLRQASSLCWRTGSAPCAKRAAHLQCTIRSAKTSIIRSLPLLVLNFRETCVSNGSHRLRLGQGSKGKKKNRRCFLASRSPLGRSALGDAKSAVFPSDLPEEQHRCFHSPMRQSKSVLFDGHDDRSIIWRLSVRTGKKEQVRYNSSQKPRCTMRVSLGRLLPLFFFVVLIFFAVSLAAPQRNGCRSSERPNQGDGSGDALHCPKSSCSSLAPLWLLSRSCMLLSCTTMPSCTRSRLASTAPHLA